MLENLWISWKIFEYFWVSLQSHNCFALDIFVFLEYLGKSLNILENIWISWKTFEYFWKSLQSHNCFALNILKACKKQLVCAQYLWGQQETTTWQQTKVMARRKCKARNPLQLERKSKWPKNKLESFSMVLFLPYSSKELFLGLVTADPLRLSLHSTYKFQISWF